MARGEKGLDSKAAPAQTRHSKQQQTSDAAQEPNPLTYRPVPQHLDELFAFAAGFIADGTVTAEPAFVDRLLKHLCKPVVFAVPDNKQPPQPLVYNYSSEAVETNARAAVRQQQKQDDREQEEELQRTKKEQKEEEEDFNPRKEKAERQRLILDLLARLEASESQDGSSAPAYDVEAILNKATEAEFYEVLVYLHKRRGAFVPALETYLQAAREAAETAGQVPGQAGRELFDYIQANLTDSKQPAQTLAAYRKAVLERLPALVKANSHRTVRLVLECLPQDNDRVVEALSSMPELQYQYLRSIVRARDPNFERRQRELLSPGGASSLSGSSSTDFMSPRPGEPSLAEVIEKAGIVVTARMQETFVRLMCQYEPREVFHYLTTASSALDSELETLRQYCEQAEITDATAWLLERSGDAQRALELMLKDVEKGVAGLRRYIEQNLATLAPAGRAITTVNIPPNVLQPIEQLLDAIIQMCIRKSALGEGDPLWFALLDRFVQMQRALKLEREKAGVELRGSITTSPRAFQLLSACLYGFVRTTLDTMMNHVALKDLLTKITTDHEGDEFKDFRDTIMGMLDTYNYEQNILETANRLLASDLYRSISSMHKRQSRAFVARQATCGTCSNPLHDQTLSSLVLFDCGHSFHENCLGRGRGTVCPICQKESKSNKKQSIRPEQRGDKQAESKGDGAEPATKPRGALQSVSSEKKTQEYISKLQLAQRRMEKQAGFISFNELLIGRGGPDNPQSLLELAPDLSAKPVVRQRRPGALAKTLGGGSGTENLEFEPPAGSGRAPSASSRGAPVKAGGTGKP